MAVTVRGSNMNSVLDASPVSTLIMCWQCGGPWNHHSKSEASRSATATPLPAASALYRDSTIALLWFWALKWVSFSDSWLAVLAAIFLENEECIDERDYVSGWNVIFRT
ncbi:hypothetical protein Ancab_031491 [Ancistrocladus abbreviatus]